MHLKSPQRLQCEKHSVTVSTHCSLVLYSLNVPLRDTATTSPFIGPVLWVKTLLTWQCSLASVLQVIWMPAWECGKVAFFWSVVMTLNRRHTYFRRHSASNSDSMSMHIPRTTQNKHVWKPQVIWNMQLRTNIFSAATETYQSYPHAQNKIFRALLNESMIVHLAYNLELWIILSKSHLYQVNLQLHLRKWSRLF